MKFQSKKGSSLVMVTIVLMVLTILAGMLVETVFQNYRLSKASGYMDYSYYAAESAVQKCIDLIQSRCRDESLARSADIAFTGNNSKDFSKSVVDELKAYLRQDTIKNQFVGIEVAGDVTASSDVAMKIEYLSCRYQPDRYPNTMFITLGITADSSYIVPLYTSGDKRAFAQKEFQVTLPQIFRLKGPIYGIGDLIADNSVLKVLGDVHIYGTSPEVLSQPEQYYYGGIYAKDNASMVIDGNAYSRSFIRTGEYSAAPDNSSIHIYKDAIAQGIHGFGKNDDIVIMRNAFTFDDLELNGENSIIAVNGSYFGLSDGSAGRHHDDSSAIVNSAIVHYANSPDSQKSRIAVNGAVMVNGGTWRLDESGTSSLYQIEDASVAWLGGPAYKMFIGDSDPTVEEYISWLKNQTAAEGFCNLFQVWNPIEIISDFEDGIHEWVNKIRASAGAGSNDASSFDNPAADSVKGFCNYVLAANDGMYYIDKGDESSTKVKKAEMLKGNFQLDNIGREGGLSWSTFWNPYIDGNWDADYCSLTAGVRNALNNVLKPGLLELANIFLTRSTSAAQGSTGALKIRHDSAKVFNSLHDALFALKGTSSYIIEPESAAQALGIAVSGNLSDPLYPFYWPENAGKYFLVINEDPDRDLVLSGTTFNGIIFTMGRVVLKNGAKVNGAVIAAGRGFDAGSTGYVSGSAADVGTVDGVETAVRAPMVMEHGENQTALDSGAYAAVYCPEGSAAVSFPYEGSSLSADDARLWLLDTFKTQDPAEPIDLYTIF